MATTNVKKSMSDISRKASVYSAAPTDNINIRAAAVHVIGDML